MSNVKTSVATLTDLDNLSVGDHVSLKGFVDAPAETGEITWVGTTIDAVDQGKLDFMAAILSGAAPEDPAVTVHAGSDDPTIPVSVIKGAYQREE